MQLIDRIQCNDPCPLQMHGGSAKFSDLYELQEDIGVGSYSICKRCVHRVSAMDYAVKVICDFCTTSLKASIPELISCCLTYIHTLL